jgi:hypothetical protein
MISIIYDKEKEDSPRDKKVLELHETYKTRRVDSIDKKIEELQARITLGVDEGSEAQIQTQILQLSNIKKTIQDETLEAWIWMSLRGYFSIVEQNMARQRGEEEGKDLVKTYVQQATDSLQDI